MYKRASHLEKNAKKSIFVLGWKNFFCTFFHTIPNVFVNVNEYIHYEVKSTTCMHNIHFRDSGRRMEFEDLNHFEEFFETGGLTLC